MGYETAERIISRAIKKSPETVQFLREKALEILEDCRIDWENSCPKEDLKDLEARWDYYDVAVKKFDKYFCEWINECYEKLPAFTFRNDSPAPIALMFQDMLDDILESVDLGNTQNFMGEIVEDDYEYRKGKPEISN